MRMTVSGPSTTSPLRSKLTSPSSPSSIRVRRSSPVIDGRVPSERSIASSRISAAWAAWMK
jgi:hypothetical protein